VFELAVYALAQPTNIRKIAAILFHKLYEICLKYDNPKPNIKVEVETHSSVFNLTDDKCIMTLSMKAHGMIKLYLTHSSL
jgi:hypothetical protein